MRNTARQTRANRTITVDFRSEATYFQLLGDGKAFLACILAFVMALGLQLKHKAACSGGGCLDPPFALWTCQAGWGHHLAHPVHHVSHGLHRAPPFRLTLSLDATGGGS
jgi:hypothetical protein